MSEKLLFEFKALPTEDRYSYKIRHCKRTFILRDLKGGTKAKGRFVKTNTNKKSIFRQALENLENLYDELYTLG